MFLALKFLFFLKWANFVHSVFFFFFLFLCRKKIYISLESGEFIDHIHCSHDTLPSILRINFSVWVITYHCPSLYVNLRTLKMLVTPGLPQKNVFFSALILVKDSLHSRYSLSVMLFILKEAHIWNEYNRPWKTEGCWYFFFVFWPPFLNLSFLTTEQRGKGKACNSRKSNV